MASVRKTHRKNVAYPRKDHDTRSKRRKVEVAVADAKDDDDQSAASSYGVTDGNIPDYVTGRLDLRTGHLQGGLTISTMPMHNTIVVEGQDINLLRFKMVIYLDQEFSAPQHVLEYGEKEVRCVMRWFKPSDNPDGTHKRREGRAAIYNSGRIRCDSRTCLPFWMELSRM
jgi:hypothetical protein